MRNYIQKALLKNKKNDLLLKKIEFFLTGREVAKKNLIIAKAKLSSSDCEEDVARELQSAILRDTKFLDKTSLFSKVKYRKRCRVTGAPRGVVMGFMRRNYFLEHARFGYVCGVKKV